MKGDTKDSLLEGSIFTGIIHFAVPVFLALVLQAAYGAVDLFVVGRFCDAASVSAVGTGSNFMQVITQSIVSLAMGTTVIIGQHIGERNQKAAGQAIGSTILIFLIIGIVLTLFLELFTGNIMNFMNAPEEAMEKSVTYLRICGGGTIVIIAYNVISAVFRGIGDTVNPLHFVFIACLVNVFLDFLLVGALHMDVAGAAVATVAAQMVSVIISLLMIRRINLPIIFTKKEFVLDKREAKAILGVGVPIMINELVTQFSLLWIAKLVNNMGLIPSAGYGVAQKITVFFLMIPSCIIQSVSAFVAQNIGARQFERAWKGFKTVVIGGTIFNVFVFCLGFFFGTALSSLFVSDAEVIAESASYLKSFCLDCLMTSTFFSMMGYLNGCGNSVPVMLQSITGALFVRIPVAYFISILPNTSMFYMGLVTPIATVYGIIFLSVCFL
ncbi:MAG: MATE family efflux transporter [Clostridiales bacterium]|nr:MATE family efflux transporter [Clostridiales bacterium]